jgi:hypothetical protein
MKMNQAQKAKRVDDMLNMVDTPYVDGSKLRENVVKALSSKLSSEEISGLCTLIEVSHAASNYRRKQ